MQYILDTHAFIWVLTNPKKLTDKTKKLISLPHHNIYISIVSIWEISLKFGIGKLELFGKDPSEIPSAIHSMGFTILNLDTLTVSTFHQLPRYNKDPFDRMLAWQSIQTESVLISKDSNFDDYIPHGLQIVW